MAESRPTPQAMRGRPGTRALSLTDNRAVGGPITLGLLALYVAVALLAWIAAAVTLLFAAPEIAGRDPLASTVVLAVHLVALGVLPFAVTAASFHLLPVMLRNDVRHPARLKLAFVLLGGGFLVAPGIAYDQPALLWPGAILVSCGLALILIELVGLALGAPGDRTLVASRTGVLLVCLHVSAALVLGAVVFAHGDATVAGVSHRRWLLIHLHLAGIGWLALLIVTVGRTLAPMLALAPTPPPRRVPAAELTLTGGLWLLLIGLATANNPAALIGGGVVLIALAYFAAQLATTARRRRLQLEAPLAHLLAGVAFLIQAAVLGVLALTSTVAAHTVVTAYVIFLLLGFGAGVTLGHIGKLLSLSIWVWWPPGPRPKQDALYPRKLWLAQAATFALGTELLAAGSLVTSTDSSHAGAALLILAALVAAAAAASTWRSRRPGSR